MKKIYMIGAALLMLLASSCREEDNDVLKSYDHNEFIAFSEAETSFASKFKVTWNGLNQYYALWDYEKELGLDWDAVYDEYLPQFEALDERDDSATVTDEEVKELLKKVLSPLHDGHFCMDWKNHKTGNIVRFIPSMERNASRDDMKIATTTDPNISFYTDLANGEIEINNGEPICEEHSTQWEDLVKDFCNTPEEGMMWIEDRLEYLNNLTLPTELEVFQRQSLSNLKSQLADVFKQQSTAYGISYFNKLVDRYSFLDVPGLQTIDKGFAESPLKLSFALLKGNIAYLYLSDFALSCYLDDNFAYSFFNLSNSTTVKHINKIRNVWDAWFSTIQELHKAGTLGGVIIDVRGNGGGFVNDAKYVAGALLPSGGFQYGYHRFKRGTGRYDYSPLIPAISLTYEEEHEIVDDKPVVLLTNGLSVSMSEMTAQVVKLMPNGKTIGKRTYGGLCALVDNYYNAENYAGFIGENGKTPVFGYVPSLAYFTMDKDQIEGVGVSPDIEVDLDVDAFITPTGFGRDTQLDRTLQYIRTAK